MARKRANGSEPTKPEKRLSPSIEPSRPVNPGEKANKAGGEGDPDQSLHSFKPNEFSPTSTLTLSTLPSLFDHQKEAVELCIQRDHLGLFFEQGLGKTATVLTAIGRLDLYPVIVVCPATVIGTWIREQQKWLPTWRTFPLVGPKDKRMQIYRKAIQIPRSLCVINYEGLRLWNVRSMYYDKFGTRRWKIANGLAESPAWKIAVLDESSRVKNAQAQQSHACWCLCKVPRRYILTGTPITKSPLDLWSQFRFLCPDEFGWSHRTFEAQYAIKETIRAAGGRQVSIVIGVRNADELYAKAARHSIRRTKEECLDLPPRIRQVEEVELSGKQRTAYRDLSSQLVANVAGVTISASTILPRLLRLQQIVQGYAPLDDFGNQYHHFEEQPKAQALEDLLERILPTSHVVIFYRFRLDTVAIRNVIRRLKEPDPYEINGDVPIPDRHGIIEEFQTNSRSKIMLCQYQTAAFGVTLTRANYVIFYSATWDLELRQQGADRIHRIGQDKTVFEIDLVAKNTIDMSILQALARKQVWAKRLDQEELRRIVEGDYGRTGTPPV